MIFARDMDQLKSDYGNDGEAGVTLPSDYIVPSMVPKLETSVYQVRLAGANRAG